MWDRGATRINKRRLRRIFVLPLRALIRIGIVGYPAARVDHVLKDGDTIRVGPLALTAHVTGWPHARLHLVVVPRS
jgi:hypothetical protein